MAVLIAIVVAVLPLTAIILWGIASWNRIVRLKNNIDQAYGSIDVYLKERFDLLPNLVSSLKQYMHHEKEILVEIARLRSQAEKGATSAEKVEASNRLGALTATLNVENYPDLQAKEQFIRFQQVLQDSEAKLAASRRSYNAAVTIYHNYIEGFPGKIMAGLRKDEKGTLLETAENEKKNADVAALFKS